MDMSTTCVSVSKARHAVIYFREGLHPQITFCPTAMKYRFCQMDFEFYSSIVHLFLKGKH